MTSVIALSASSVVEVKGRDAAAFLQAQTMNDVAALAPGRWHWNGLLNAKGRVLFLFQLLAIEPDVYWLLQPVPRGESLREHLLRYRFRSKVTIEHLADMRVTAREVEREGAGDWCHDRLEGGRVLDLRPLRGGTLEIGFEQDAGDPAGEHRWHAQDLSAGIPHMDETVAGAFTPQMLRLDRIAAYSVRKGCYPGQEVVARTHFLGAAKRQAQLLRANFHPSPGTKLLSPGGESLGDVADSVPVGDGSLLIGVLKEPLDDAASIETADGLLAAAQRTVI